MLLKGETPQFPVEIDSADPIKVVSEKWFDSNGVEISGDNIAVAGGTYRYELKLSADEGFYFDNDLKINYQGIDGEYKLNYSFPPGDDSNHTMIVSGDFDNIIAASPLIDKIDVGKVLALVISEQYTEAIDFILDDGVPFSDKATIDDISKIYPVSNDKYSYELVLKTKEGFSFDNELQFLYDEDKYGFTIDYDYDLLNNKHTLKIQGTAEKKQTTPDDPGVIDPTAVTGADIIDKVITNMDKDSDLIGSVFAKLQLKSPEQTKTTIKLRWKKVSKAQRYVIYGNKCGSANKPKKLATVKESNKAFKTLTMRKLKKGTYYKFMIVAIDRNDNVVSVSRMIYVATKGGKVGNHKSVTVSKSVIAKAKKLKKGRTLKLNARTVAQSKKLTIKKHAVLRYESTNSKIATVSKSGKITAKKKGTCYVYAYAQDGVYKKVKVTVK